MIFEELRTIVVAMYVVCFAGPLINVDKQSGAALRQQDGGYPAAEFFDRAAEALSVFSFYGEGAVPAVPSLARNK